MCHFLGQVLGCAYTICLYGRIQISRISPSGTPCRPNHVLSSFTYVIDGFIIIIIIIIIIHFVSFSHQFLQMFFFFTRISATAIIQADFGCIGVWMVLMKIIVCKHVKQVTLKKFTIDTFFLPPIVILNYAKMVNYLIHKFDMHKNFSILAGGSSFKFLIQLRYATTRLLTCYNI